MREPSDIAPLASRLKRAADVAKARAAQKADAWDFTHRGDEDGRHAATCVHARAGDEPCSRTYDPLPYPEAMPAEPHLYDDTGIAALYGLPGGEAHAWQLAGWNIEPRSTR